jgi:hypothetical protein
MNEYMVIAHPKGRNFELIRHVVQTVNGLQNYFRCDLIKTTRVLSGKEEQVPAETFGRNIIAGSRRRLPIIALTKEYYDPNWYVIEHHLPDLVLITCAEWDTKNTPALRLFLIYALASSLITLHAKLTAKMNEDMAHDPPVGCVFDWWDDEKMFTIGMVSGRLCHDCQRRLQQNGVPSVAFLAVQKILEYVRRALIGQETAVATKVFIAHGRSDDWLQLKAILEDLGLEIAEFNETPAAGVLVPERWKEMLDQSRFAFALLTPDDKDVHHNSIPRFNVVHEIGLCHARLGLESTAILREKSVSLFSNIDGINRIDYEGGRLAEKKQQITQLLKDRGVL